MKFTTALTVAFATVATASPLAKRATDADILNYALTLEHLEDTFYRQGLANFTQSDFKKAGFDATLYANIQKVASDEATHVQFLTSALTAAGAQPVAECQYAFPVTTVKDFLTVASVLEGVGVSAYLGAAAQIMSKTYLTAAGSILTVEARHSSYLRSGLGQVPFPQAFDSPLTLNEVYTLAAQFIVSCPSTNVKLPVKAFPALAMAPASGPVTNGSTVTVSVAGGKDVGATVYGAFITVTGPVFTPVTKGYGGYTVVIPSGVSGQSYFVLTNNNANATDDTVVAGPAIIEIS